MHFPFFIQIKKLSIKFTVSKLKWAVCLFFSFSLINITHASVIISPEYSGLVIEGETHRLEGWEKLNRVQVDFIRMALTPTQGSVKNAQLKFERNYTNLDISEYVDGEGKIQKIITHSDLEFNISAQLENNTEQQQYTDHIINRDFGHDFTKAVLQGNRNLPHLGLTIEPASEQELIENEYFHMNLFNDASYDNYYIDYNLALTIDPFSDINLLFLLLSDTMENIEKLNLFSDITAVEQDFTIEGKDNNSLSASYSQRFRFNESVSDSDMGLFNNKFNQSNSLLSKSPIFNTFDIESIEIAEKTVSVPEPSTFILMALGVIGVLSRYSSQKKVKI